MRKKSNSPVGFRLGLLTILLVAVLLVSVGITWARYRKVTWQDLNYQAKDYAAVRIWRGYDATTDTLAGGQNSWTTTADGKKSLSFYISNGVADTNCAQDTLQAYVRLRTTLGVQNVENNMQVQLWIAKIGETEGETYLGTVQEITEGTPLYQKFGSGWFVTFLDDSGKELSWTLEGGVRSVLQAKLTVWGVEADDSMLQLAVSGDTIT